MIDHFPHCKSANVFVIARARHRLQAAKISIVLNKEELTMSSPISLRIKLSRALSRSRDPPFSIGSWSPLILKHSFNIRTSLSSPSKYSRAEEASSSFRPDGFSWCRLLPDFWYSPRVFVAVLIHTLITRSFWIRTPAELAFCSTSFRLQWCCRYLSTASTTFAEQANGHDKLLLIDITLTASLRIPRSN